MITAARLSAGSFSRRLSSVVLPAPRKPVSTVNGIGAGGVRGRGAAGSLIAWWTLRPAFPRSSAWRRASRAVLGLAPLLSSAAGAAAGLVSAEAGVKLPTLGSLIDGVRLKPADAFAVAGFAAGFAAAVAVSGFAAGFASGAVRATAVPRFSFALRRLASPVASLAQPGPHRDWN
jgi:hypothetical protein